jgi:hypothetical protein
VIVAHKTVNDWCKWSAQQDATIQSYWKWLHINHKRGNERHIGMCAQRIQFLYSPPLKIYLNCFWSRDCLVLIETYKSSESESWQKRWKYISTILDLGTRWRQVVSFMPRPLYPWGNCHQCPLDRRLDRPQSQSWCYGEEKHFASAGNQALASQPISPLLYWLSYPDYWTRKSACDKLTSSQVLFALWL